MSKIILCHTVYDIFHHVVSLCLRSFYATPYIISCPFVMSKTILCCTKYFIVSSIGLCYSGCFIMSRKGFVLHRVFHHVFFCFVFKVLFSFDSLFVLVRVFSPKFSSIFSRPFFSSTSPYFFVFCYFFCCCFSSLLSPSSSFFLFSVFFFAVFSFSVFSLASSSFFALLLLFFFFFFSSSSSYRLVGLVVRCPPGERKVPGSNPACAGIFSGSSHTSDFKIGTPVATLPGAWRYWVSAGTGRPGVSIL